MEKKEKTPKQYEIDKKIRKDWGDVRPFSQYFRDKTKYRRKEKYRKDYLETEE